MQTLVNDIVNTAGTSQIALLVLMSLIDIVLGIAKALYSRKFNSTISTNGLIKHMTMIILPILAHPLFNVIENGDTYFTAFVSLIIVTMVSSILENYAQMGLPYPEFFHKLIDDRKLEVNRQSGKDPKKLLENTKDSED